MLCNLFFHIFSFAMKFACQICQTTIPETSPPPQAAQDAVGDAADFAQDAAADAADFGSDVLKTARTRSDGSDLRSKVRSARDRTIRTF